MEKRITVGISLRVSTKRFLEDIAKNRSIGKDRIITVSSLIRDAIDEAYGPFKAPDSDDTFVGGITEEED
jgi:hypothetical protein